MNTTKNFVGLSLGLGLLMASANAFAQTPYGYDNRRVPYGHDDRRVPHGNLVGYDTNGDQHVSLAEFQQRELARCDADFRQNDRDQDGVLNAYERTDAMQIHCDAWTTARDFVPVPQRGRWQPVPYRYQSGYGFQTANAYRRGTYGTQRGRYGMQRDRYGMQRDDGLTWNELRAGSLEQSRREFARADCDRSGLLTRHELNEYVQSEYRENNEFQETWQRRS